MIGKVIHIGWCLVCKRMRRLHARNFTWQTRYLHADTGYCPECSELLDEDARRGN